MCCPAARIGLQPAHSLCGLCQDLWCPLTNHFLAVKFLRFVNNVADKCTAITQHLHWVLKQGYLLLEERRRMSAHPSSEEWSIFYVSKEKKECLGGWIVFPESLWSTNGTALSLWGIPAAQKGPTFVIHLLEDTACNAHTLTNSLWRWNQLADDGFPTKALCHHCEGQSGRVPDIISKGHLISALWFWSTVIQDNLPWSILGHLIKSQVVSTHDFMVSTNI